MQNTFTLIHGAFRKIQVDHFHCLDGWLPVGISSKTEIGNFGCGKKMEWDELSVDKMHYLLLIVAALISFGYHHV